MLPDPMESRARSSLRKRSSASASSAQLHFAIHSIWIEHRLGCARMRAGERAGIGGFDELQKGAGQARLFEHPEFALRLRVVLLLALQPLEEAFALVGRDERALNSQ